MASEERVSINLKLSLCSGGGGELSALGSWVVGREREAFVSVEAPVNGGNF